jgi:2-aminoadipate transaminase
MEDHAALLSTSARQLGSSMIRDLLHLLEQPGVLSLAGGLPAADALPVERVRVAMLRALERPGRYGPAALQYGPTEGLAELRALVAAEHRTFDGRTDPDDVIVTTGSQQALDLISRVLLDRGDTVIVEVPSYLGALQAMSAWGPRFVGIRTDEHGMRTDELESQLGHGVRPKLCYLVPTFQNPSGATLAAERRAHLGALAERYGFVVVEDDPYRALRFAGAAVAPVRAHTSLAVTLGSASKVLAPGLRVGWAAAPPWLYGPLVRAKQAADLHTSTFAQLAVHDVLADAAFLEGHLRALCDRYRQRCDALVASLHHTFGDRCHLARPEGGLFVWSQFPGLDTAARLARAVDAGVAYVPGTAFTTDGSGHDHARLSFATLDAPELDEAARRLALALHAHPVGLRCPP